jgi:ribonuclease HII
MTLATVQIGIDENGLGSQLGPMIVTAVRLEIDRAKVANHAALVRATERAGIGDSKAVCSHGSMASAEAMVLSLFESHLGIVPVSLDALVQDVGLDDHAALRTDCPSGEASVACFGDPIALPAFGPGPSDRDRATSRALARSGVRLAGVRVGVLCAKRIHLAKRAGRSRFDLDLATMTRLAAAVRGEANGPEVTVLCGKVGARKSYASALESLSPIVGILDERRDLSSYRLPGFGQVSFVLDGDATEPAIGLASLVGKYVRELWMHRINQYWLRAVPTAVSASGYHDPVTARLVSATTLARKARGIPDECFAR